MPKVAAASNVAFPAATLCCIVCTGVGGAWLAWARPCVNRRSGDRTRTTRGTTLNTRGHVWLHNKETLRRLTAERRTLSYFKRHLSALGFSKSFVSTKTGAEQIAGLTPTERQRVSLTASQPLTMPISGEATCRSGVRSFKN